MNQCSDISRILLEKLLVLVSAQKHPHTRYPAVRTERPRWKKKSQYFVTQDTKTNQFIIIFNLNEDKANHSELYLS